MVRADGQGEGMNSTAALVTVTLNVISFSGSLHAGEFTHEGRLYCAAHVPASRGYQWELEVKNAPLNVDGGWEKVAANFRHNTRKQTLEITLQ
jgi:hypothetical protein